MDIAEIIMSAFILLGAAFVFYLAGLMVWEEFICGSRVHLAVRRLITRR